LPTCYPDAHSFPTRRSSDLQLMHPRFGVRRTYLAKVAGVPRPEQIDRLRSGVRLEDGRARALDAAVQSRTPRNTWVRVVVSEGRDRKSTRLNSSHQIISYAV